MPDEVLTPWEADDERRPVAGFFGKLPTTGDFVWRGLPDGFRRHWDAWLTRHIAPLQRKGWAFPPGGLRFRLPSGGRLAVGVILPSQDSADRLFPLSLLLIAEADLTPVQIDPWCDAALALQPATLPPEALWQALDALPAPVPAGPVNGPPQLWSIGHPILTADAPDAGAAIARLVAPELPPG